MESTASESGKMSALGNSRYKMNKAFISGLIILTLSFARSLPWQENQMWYAIPIRQMITWLTYLGMIGYWGITIQKRVIQVGIRKNLLRIVWCMIFWLIIRELKWHYLIFPTSVRYLWYLFYVPIILIPFFATVATEYIGKAEDERVDKKWLGAFAVGVALILLVLTNDLHGLVFAMTGPTDAEPYQYGIGYFCIVLWVIIFSIYFVISVGKKCSQRVIGKKRWIPFFYIAIGVLYGIFYAIDSSETAGGFVELTVAYGWLTVMIIESCITLGMIPVNDKHEIIFENSTIGGQIVDENGNPFTISQNAKPMDEELFLQLKTSGTVSYEKGLEMHLYPLNHGYMVWMEDVKKINEMVEEVLRKQAEIEEKNSIAQEEMNVQVRQKKVQESNRIYTLLMSQMKDDVDKLRGLSLKIKQEKKEETARELLQQINMLGVYLKRKSNLIMLCETGEQISPREMDLCLMEMGRNLEACGGKIRYQVLLNRNLSLQESLWCLDTIRKFYEEAVLNKAEEKDAENLFNIEICVNHENQIQCKINEMNFSYEMSLNDEMHSSHEMFSTNGITSNNETYSFDGIGGENK